MPSFSSMRIRSTCCFLVSGFLTEIVQHIHSLRASGVRSSHAASASASAARVCRKSSGNSWTTPPEIAWLVFVIRLYYYNTALSCKDGRSERASSIEVFAQRHFDQQRAGQQRYPNHHPSGVKNAGVLAQHPEEQREEDKANRGERAHPGCRSRSHL